MNKVKQYVLADIARLMGLQYGQLYYPMIAGRIPVVKKKHYTEEDVKVIRTWWAQHGRTRVAEMAGNED